MLVYGETACCGEIEEMGDVVELKVVVSLLEVVAMRAEGGKDKGGNGVGVGLMCWRGSGWVPRWRSGEQLG